MKPRNVSVSIVDTNEGLKVWCATFTLKGSLRRNADGMVDEKARKAKQKEIAKVLETLVFPEDGVSNGSDED